MSQLLINFGGWEGWSLNRLGNKWQSRDSDQNDLILKAALFRNSRCLFESACNSGDLGSIPGSGRSPGEINGKPLQYSCLENTRDRGGWQAVLHRVARIRHDLALSLLFVSCCKCHDKYKNHFDVTVNYIHLDFNLTPIPCCILKLLS